MRTHYYCNRNIKFKQINSVQHTDNRLVGCSAALQPEYFALNVLEDHCCIK